MAKDDPPKSSAPDKDDPPKPVAGREAASASPEPFAAASRHFVLACAAIAGGLAIAGTLDRSAGGVVVLIGWVAGIYSLHRLGRAGSRPRPS